MKEDRTFQERPLREEVIRVARLMNHRGLNQGTSGNISVRVPGGMLITPSAVPYDRLEPEGIVRMALDGSAAANPAKMAAGTAARTAPGTAAEGTAPTGRPSTEWRMHAGILRARPEVGSVLHAHAPFCTALACLRREIPAFHYMVAVAGGRSIRCAPYATFGTPELAALALEALDGRRACLLANHGMLALAESPSAALDLAIEVEALAAAYWRALQVGEPVLLSDTEMAAVEEKFSDYRAGAG